MVELLVALLITAVGTGALLSLFVQTARTAKRDALLSQAHAYGSGVIAEWQARPRADALAELAQGQGEWPEAPTLFPGTDESVPTMRWQWRWQGEMTASSPLAVELHITWTDTDERVRLPATL